MCVYALGKKSGKMVELTKWQKILKENKSDGLQKPNLCQRRIKFFQRQKIKVEKCVDMIVLAKCPKSFSILIDLF